MTAKTFDLQPLLEAVGADKEIMSQVIEMFISTSREGLDAIRAAIQRQDPKGVKTSAHHLKGSLLEMGAAEAVALAFELEKMGSEQKLDGADKVWQGLEKAVTGLVQDLNQTEYRRTA